MAEQRNCKMQKQKQNEQKTSLDWNVKTNIYLLETLGDIRAEFDGCVTLSGNQGLA